MKRRAQSPIIPALLTLCAAALLGSCASTESIKDFNPEELISRVERNAYFVHQFEAKFTKTRTLSMFDRDLTVDAHLVFQKPGKFRLVTDGDVNVEILSDGRIVTMIHDGEDMEIHRLRGDRDLSRFSDPMMQVLNNLGRGALRAACGTCKRIEEDGLVIELRPGNTFCPIEPAGKAEVRLGPNAEPQVLRILYENGDVDEIRFVSWRVLAADDPAVLALNKRLAELARTERKADRSGALTLTYLRERSERIR